MAALKGIGGKVMVGAAAVAFVESWEMQIANSTLDTTGLGSTGKSFIGSGLPESTWSINWKALDNSDTATAALRAAALDNTTGIQLKLYESSTKYWDSGAGNAFISAFTQSTSVDGLVTGNCSGVFSTSPTYT